jgi:phage/plasmid primase-like uncharacterized protein
MTLSANQIDRARAVPIDKVVAALRLRRAGRELVGPCPVCSGTDRFGVHLGKQVFHCRGCGARGDVIALTMHVHDVDFRGAVEMLTGISPTPAQRQRQAPTAMPAAAPDNVDVLARADAIWRQAVPIAGTAGAVYLAGRGIVLDDVPRNGGLRFHPACPYGPLDPDRPDGPRRIVPCIVARYTDVITGSPRGIHRRAIAAGIEPKTMSYGPTGGAVVRLWPDAAIARGLVIGEGIETVLAAATRIVHRGALLHPAWACGTSGNIKAFPVLVGVEDLTILADHDAPDKRGRRAGQEAAAHCAQRWADAGREVTILTPRELGDMNDVVRKAVA